MDVSDRWPEPVRFQGEGLMRNLFRAVGVLVALAVLASGGWSWTDKKPQPPGPRTSIAVVNLAYVLKHYEKATEFQASAKDYIETAQRREKELREKLDELKKKLEGEKEADKREEIEKEGRKLSRKLEEFKIEAQQSLIKKQEKHITELYTEIRHAAQRYAIAHDIALVMHYNDADPESPEFNSPQNIARKIQAGACMPLYIAPGLDISKELAESLNEEYRKEKAARSDCPD
jgi:Skp family chaperone for outer membrane proteins